MKPSLVSRAAILAFCTAALLLPSCHKQKPVDDKKRSPSPTAAAPANAAASAEIDRETPLLPVKIGDTWRYKVRIEVPAGASSQDSPASDTTHERVRTYLGKIVAAAGKPAVDCFEIDVPGAPTERELVEITKDRIMMRGSILITNGIPGNPMWLEPAVPFIAAGIRVGSSLPELSVADGTRTRKTAVVGREEVTVPAGTFKSIRLLMSGTDGPLEMRRTIWFAPGIGIIREDNARYAGTKLLLRETHQLLETSVKH